MRRRGAPAGPPGADRDAAAAGRVRSVRDGADPGDPPDRELVSAAQAGDAAALDALLRRHVDRLHNLCRRMTGDDADAADATQEALMAIVRGLPRFDGQAAFSTWAHKVTANACLDELRRRRRRPLTGRERDLASEAFDPGTVGPGRSELAPRPEAVGDPAQQVVDRLAVDGALRALAPEARAAVVLRDVCDFDYAEIASTLGIPPGTVRSRISRGRAAVAAALSSGPGPPATGFAPVTPVRNRERPSGRPTS